MTSVLVVGGAGQMGRLFANYFKEERFKVSINDVDLEKGVKVAEELKVKFEPKLEESVNKSDIIIVSVPIDKTPKVLRKVHGLLKREGIIVEISSIKSETVKVIKEIGRNKVKFLSLHPLFGPGAETPKGQKIALIPIFNLKEEYKLSVELLGESEIIVVNQEEHDEAMSIVLSLTHFINLAFLETLRKKKLSHLEKISGPTFHLQLLTGLGILSQKTDLCVQLQTSNPYFKGTLERFIEATSKLKCLLTDKQGYIRHVDTLKKETMSKVDYEKAYREVYDLMAALKGKAKSPTVK